MKYAAVLGLALLVLVTMRLDSAEADCKVSDECFDHDNTNYDPCPKLFGEGYKAKEPVPCPEEGKSKAKCCNDSG